MHAPSPASDPHEFTTEQWLRGQPESRSVRALLAVAPNAQSQSATVLAASAEQDPILAALLAAIDLEHAHAVTDALIATRRDAKIITFFGSSRVKAGHPEYNRAEELAERIALRSPDTIFVQGGAGGVMEAVGKGARQADAATLGCVMHNDSFVDQGKGFDAAGWGIHAHNSHILRFLSFQARMSFMTHIADAIVVSSAMGGGAADELTHAFVTHQYGKKKPLIILGEAPAGSHALEMYRSMHRDGLISRHQGVLEAGQDGDSLITHAKDATSAETYLQQHGH